MKIGDKIRAFGEDFEILDIKSRNEWALEGRFEPKGVELLGDGIIGKNLETGVKEYFYDFDVDMPAEFYDQFKDEEGEFDG